jgi:hypothetical protein
MPRHLALNALLIGATWAACAAHSRAGPVTVTFDEPQLVDNDPVLTFYDGGTTFKGIGGGPDLGIVFTLNARVRTVALTGTYTAPGWMQLFSDTVPQGAAISAQMTVAGGFVSSVSFDYAAIDAAGELKVFSGPNGSGTLLADLNLPVTSPITGPSVFVADVVNFSGVAQSITFNGGNKQLGFDDFALIQIPEPSAWSLLAIGVGCCALAQRWKTAAVTRARRASN